MLMIHESPVSHFGNIQQALETVRRAFPTLRDVPDYKIEFTVPPRPGMDREGPLITILDDAWGAMVTSAPEAMLVSVTESPEEYSRR
jgi:hypothetical protein